MKKLETWAAALSVLCLMKKLVKLLAAFSALIAAISAVQGWRWYRKVYPRNAMAIGVIGTPEEWKGRSAPDAIACELIRQSRLRLPKGPFRRLSLLFAERMLSFRLGLLFLKQDFFERFFGKLKRRAGLR